MNDFDKELLASNLIGAKTIKELSIKEQLLTTDKIIQIKKDPIQGNFDYAHLKEINRILFADIYVWAGFDRYDIGYRGVFRKGDTEFTHGNHLPEVAKDLFDALKSENYFKNLDREEFIKSAASFLNGLNILHPFREGNGRTQRLFMELLAQNAGYPIDLSTVSKTTTIQSCILGAKGKLTGFEKIIKYALI